MVRFKHRYFVLEMVWEDGRVDKSLKARDILSKVRASLGKNFGDYGSCICGCYLQVKYLNNETGTLILRSSRDFHTQVWTAVSLISHLKGRRVAFRCLHISGTIVKSQKLLVRYQERICRDAVSDAMDET